MGTKRFFQFEIIMSYPALSASFKYLCYVSTTIINFRILPLELSLATVTHNFKWVKITHICLILNQTFENLTLFPNKAWRYRGETLILDRGPKKVNLQSSLIVLWFSSEQRTAVHITPALVQCLVLTGWFVLYIHVFPTYARRWTNVVLMLARRRRQWANIKTTLVPRWIALFALFESDNNRRP